MSYVNLKYQTDHQSDEEPRKGGGWPWLLIAAWACVVGLATFIAAC